MTKKRTMSHNQNADSFVLTKSGQCLIAKMLTVFDKNKKRAEFDDQKRMVFDGQNRAVFYGQKVGST